VSKPVQNAMVKGFPTSQYLPAAFSKAASGSSSLSASSSCSLICTDPFLYGFDFRQAIDSTPLSYERVPLSHRKRALARQLKLRLLRLTGGGKPASFHLSSAKSIMTTTTIPLTTSKMSAVSSVAVIVPPPVTLA